MTQTIGSRRQVWNGTAKKTSGGLTKSDLMMSHGRIVSKSKHFSAKKEMRLLKYGYGTKKGKFGYVKLNKKSSRKGMSGGHVNIGSALSASGIDGSGITNYDSLGSVGVQIQAGMAGGRSRSRSRSRSHSRSRRMAMTMAGGALSPLSPADSNASYMIKDVVPQSFSPLDRALVGGRKHRKKMRGGTTKPFAELNGTPLAAALVAS